MHTRMHNRLWRRLRPGGCHATHREPHIPSFSRELCFGGVQLFCEANIGGAQLLNLSLLWTKVTNRGAFAPMWVHVSHEAVHNERTLCPAQTRTCSASAAVATRSPALTASTTNFSSRSLSLRRCRMMASLPLSSLRCALNPRTAGAADRLSAVRARCCGGGGGAAPAERPNTRCDADSCGRGKASTRECGLVHGA